jgi:hypothetical protein
MIMHILNESEAAALRGGFFTIAIAPTINVGTAVTTAVQPNAGASVALGLLGGVAGSSLGQLNSLGILSLI